MSKYEVWVSQGQGGAPGPTFPTLEEALIHAKKGIANKEGSFGIKLPNGEWYDWDKHDIAP